MFVLDTSALLARMQGEPGGARTEEVLLSGHCYMSSVNLAEFAAKCADRGMTRGDVLTILGGFDIQIVEFDTDLALTTGALRTPTRSAGLSLGDRACLALALQLNATALTTDRPWTKLDLGIAVECIR